MTKFDKFREFSTTILLGLFIGIIVGWLWASHEITVMIAPAYQGEIKRLQKWNDTLVQSLLPLSPFPHPKKGGKLAE